MWALSLLEQSPTRVFDRPTKRKSPLGEPCGLCVLASSGAYPCANRDRSMPLLTNGGNMPQNNHACKIYLFFSINSFNMRLSQRSAPRSVYALCCSGVSRTRIMMVGGAGGLPAPSRLPPFTARLLLERRGCGSGTRHAHHLLRFLSTLGGGA